MPRLPSSRYRDILRAMTIQRIEPGPGQESVWDYPRPPALEDSTGMIEIRFNGVTIAETRRAKRVLETSHPPVYYIPPDDVRMEFLHAEPARDLVRVEGARPLLRHRGQRPPGRSRGLVLPAADADLRADEGATSPSIPRPWRPASSTASGCRLQEGDFYGGWVTRDIVGPFKGGAGTLGW